MLKIIYFFRGYLKIMVGGVAPERFMNLCAAKNIMLWNIHEEAQGYSMYITLKSFWCIKSIVRKTSTRVVVLKRIGLPFLMKKIKKSIILFLGIILFLILFLISQLFIWQIKITGNVSIDSKLIKSCMEQEGVHIKMQKSKIDTDHLEKTLRKNFPEITWVSVYLSGNELHVHIKENDKIILLDETEKDEIYQDICALIPGTIEYIVTRKGTPYVKKGMHVEKEDILVSGKIEVYDNDGNIKEYQYLSADADIIISGQIAKQFETSSEKKQKIYTGNYKDYSYIKIGEKIHLIKFFQHNYDMFDTEILSRIQFPKDKSISFETGVLRIKEVKFDTSIKTPEEYKAELQKQLEDYVLTLSEKGIQIISKNVKIKKSMDIVRMEVILSAKGRFIYTRNGYFGAGSARAVRDAGSIY